MWLICGVLSVAFCVIGWLMVSKQKKIAFWASVCSLAFVSLTLLMEYRAVLQWVEKEDWSAMMDVVPPMFSLLIIYVILLLVVNIVLLGLIKKKS